MKNIKLLIAALLISVSAYAQQDAQAKAILNQVSQKYRSYNTVKAEFTFTADNPQAGDRLSQTGTLIARSKANKFKVAIYGKGSKVPEQEIISDGKTQWTYLKADKEVQVANAGKGDGELNPAQLFTMYEHGYKYLYTGEQKNGGRICQVIDLSPVDAGTEFFKVRLWIDKLKKQLYSATIFDKGGAHYTYTITGFTPDVTATDNTFVYNKATHPEVEVVDLR